MLSVIDCGQWGNKTQSMSGLCLCSWSIWEAQNVFGFMKIEPQHEKTSNVDFDQVWHKQGCAATGDG